MAAPHVIAVLDSDPDTSEILKTWFEFKGFVAAVGSLIDFRLGNDDLLAFLRRTSPDVIVYDLGIPYESNYEYFKKISADPAFPTCPVVITTTNGPAVERLLGIQAIEIVGKPYDLEVLVQAIRSAGDGDGTAPGFAGEDRRQRDRRTGDRRRGADRRKSDTLTGSSLRLPH